MSNEIIKVQICLPVLPLLSQPKRMTVPSGTITSRNSQFMGSDARLNVNTPEHSWSEPSTIPDCFGVDPDKFNQRTKISF